MALTNSDLHFLKMAVLQGEKSSFGRKKRGALIAKHNKIVGIGISSHLNPSATESDLGNMDENEKYAATVNAEIVALSEVVKHNISLEECTLYASDCPNWLTFKYLAQMGIKRIICSGPVTNQRTLHFAGEMGIEIIGVGPGHEVKKEN